MNPKICSCDDDTEYFEMLFKLGFKGTDEIPEVADVLLKLFQLLKQKRVI